MYSVIKKLINTTSPYLTLAELKVSTMSITVKIFHVLSVLFSSSDMVRRRVTLNLFIWEKHKQCKDNNSTLFNIYQKTNEKLHKKVDQ